MKAVVYKGPRDVGVRDIPDPRIEQATDALVQITSTNICGSDLHMYEGRTDFEQGRAFGHENLGRVIAVGQAVEKIKVGDWVCLPFNVACGHCVNCERGLTNYCLIAQPAENMAAAAYGFADMGPWQGGQAEYLIYGGGPVGLMAAYSAAIKGACKVMVVDRHPERLRLAESIGALPIDDSEESPVQRVLEE